MNKFVFIVFFLMQVIISAADSFVIVSPNGGESWRAGTDQTILWTNNVSTDVKIELYKNGSFNSTITSSTSSDGSYTWNIPAGTALVSDYTIKITSIIDRSITDVSNAEFTITAPLAVQTKFAVIGDYGDDSSGEQAVADLINSWNVDFIITTGDNSYGNTPIDENIGKYYADYIGNYIGSYGSGSPINKFFPSLGNHDYSDGGGLSAYLNYFTLPGISGNSSGNERYFDFVHGNIHLFAINSNSKELDGRDGSSIQANWLQTQMTNSTAKWKIVYDHHPPYSSGPHGSSTVMRWDFSQWGADAVMSGHDHTYERLEVDGLTFFVNGLGGKSTYNFSNILPESQLRYNGDYGAMLVEATESTLTAKFYNTSGVLIDTWSKNNSPVSITEPNGGENWQVNTTETIGYEKNFSSNVKIELYKEDIFHLLIDSEDGGDSFTWNIPDTLSVGSDYKVKITSLQNPDVFDHSDSTFTLHEGSISITSPNGGEVWLIGLNYIITWDDEVEGSVSIELYKSGSFLSFIDNLDNGNTRSWTIPDAIKSDNDYTIKVTSVSKPTVSDYSDDSFTILAVSADYTLSQNFPNPFNTSTIITYGLVKEGNVELTIYDVLGNEVLKFNEQQDAGFHNVEFNGFGFGSGIYYYKLQAGDFVETKKMVLMK
jgi:hypothetical protein